MTEAARTVLVVDDDAMNRLILTNLLDAGGYRTVTATDGAEALAALEEEDVDAILLDVVMPGVDGVGVLQSVKASAVHWRVPVIMVSAVEETEAIVRCLQLGAEDYVTKPFDPVLLRARLDACLARRRFGDLEDGYHRLVEEQANELDRLRADLVTIEQDLEVVAGARRGRLGIVVAGLSGLNGLAPALEPDEALGVAGAFFDVVWRCAIRHGAIVQGTGPQEVSVLVGALRPVPDPAAIALRLAQDVVEEMEPLTAEWTGRHGGRWVAGAGVATGEAVVGIIGTEAAVRAAVGPVVDDAHRRCQDALERGGGIVLEDGRPGP